MFAAFYLLSFFYCAAMIALAFHEFNKDPWCKWAGLLPGMCGFALFPVMNLIVALVAHYLFYIDGQKEKQS